MEKSISTSGNSVFNGDDRKKLSFEKLMKDIADLTKDLEEKFQGNQVLKNDFTLNIDNNNIKKMSGHPPSYARAQRELLLKEYADRIKSVTTCNLKNSNSCPVCHLSCKKILQELLTWRNYALRYRVGKLKRKTVSINSKTPDCEPKSIKPEPLGPHGELRLGTETFQDNFFSCEAELVKVVVMTLSEDMAKAGINPNDVLLEDLHIIMNENHIGSKSELKKMKKMQNMLHSTNNKDLKCIQRELQFFNDAVIETIMLEQYAASYLLQQQAKGVVPTPLTYQQSARFHHYLNSYHKQRFSLS